MAGLFKEGFLALLRSGTFSDLIIECGNVEFKVHKTVVCASSPMLMAACSGRFEESLNGRIKFPEEDTDTMSRVILFLYTGDYDANQVPSFTNTALTVDHLVSAVAEGESEEDEFAPLKAHTLVYKCADMLGVEKLKTLAAERLLEGAQTALRKDGFSEVLRLIYDSTSSADNILRHRVTELCVRKRTELPESVKECIKEYELGLWVCLVSLLDGFEKQQKATEERHLEDKQYFVERMNQVIRDNCPHCCDGVEYLYLDEGDVFWSCFKGCKHSL